MRAPLSRLWIGTIVAFVLLCAAAAVRTADWSYGADTGTFVQIVHDALGGMRNGVEGTTHYRFHWSPTLMLLWPFLTAAHSVWILQAILAAATVACAPLLAAIARRGFSGSPVRAGVADRVGAVALVYPPLIAVGFGEFRDLGLLPVLALAWWYALQTRRWAWTAVCAVLLAGLREDVCLELALIAVYVAATCRQPPPTRPNSNVAASPPTPNVTLSLSKGAPRSRVDRPKLAAALGSAAVALISVSIYAFIVLPRVGPWPPSHFYDYPFAHGPAALLLAPLMHPLAFGAAILTVGRLTYVLEALIPLALIPLRARLAWLAVPGFAIVLLANSGLVWRMGMHYAALWIPWLLIAFAAGVATLRHQRRWTTVAFVLSAIVLIAFSPLHPLHYLKPSYHALGDARAVLASIPSDAPVATHDEWYTAISARDPNASVLGTGPQSIAAPYIVFAEDYPNDDFRTRVLPQIRSALQAGNYTLVARRGAVSAWKAGPPRTPR